MSNFGDFARGAVGGFANATGMLADQQIKLNLDEIINNRQLDLKVRMKAMDEQMNEAAAARERARVSKYATTEVTETVPGVATAVDDEGNSNSPNDYKIRRKRTLEEVRNAMVEGGDIKEANTVSVMSDRDEDRKSRERLVKEQITSREKIAEDNNETKLSLKFDKDGKPIVTGKGASNITARINAFDRDITANNREIETFQKQIFKLDELEIAKALTLSDEEKAENKRKKQSYEKIITDLRSKNDGLHTKKDRFIEDIGSGVAPKPDNMLGTLPPIESFIKTKKG